MIVVLNAKYVIQMYVNNAMVQIIKEIHLEMI